MNENQKNRQIFTVRVATFCDHFHWITLRIVFAHRLKSWRMQFGEWNHFYFNENKERLFILISVVQIIALVYCRFGWCFFFLLSLISKFILPQNRMIRNGYINAIKSSSCIATDRIVKLNWTHTHSSHSCQWVHWFQLYWFIELIYSTMSTTTTATTKKTK